MNSIKGLSWQGDDPANVLRTLSLRRHSRLHLQKSKSGRQKQLIPKNLLDSQSLKLIMSMTLHDRTTKSLLHLHKKKKPPSISAQFQASLNKLLETLGKAEPFFIRCIRSNSEKMEMTFDEALVLQQLRYTGMLETVRIRRSGYSAKYPYQEFKDQFQVLLPKSSPDLKTDITSLLNRLYFDPHNYQLGKTKVFMKEPERQKLQDTLHQAVIKKIILLQSLFRMVVDRRNFLRMKSAAVSIQAFWRSYRVRCGFNARKNAAVCIQAAWKSYVQRKIYVKQIQLIQILQAHCRGFLQRQRVKVMLEEKQKAEEEKRKQEASEKERQALLKAQREEQKKMEKEAKRQAELKQSGASGIEPVTPSAPENDTSGKQTETLLDKGPVRTERNIFKTTDREERIPKENEHNRTIKEESLGGDSNSQAQQQASFGDHATAINVDPWIPLSPKAETNFSDRTSARTERENRRQRCLMHDMLQNKHISTSLVEAEKGQDGAKEQLHTCSKDGVAVIPREEKSDKEKEVAKANMTEKTNHDQNLGKPLKPPNLELNIQQVSQKQLSEETNKQNTPQDADVPSVGIIQRYSDHEKLRNKAEKWKEKRQTETNLTESASTPDRDAVHLRQDSKEVPPRAKGIIGTTQASTDIQSSCIPQLPPLSADNDKDQNKPNLQKKKSIESKAPPDSSAQSTDKHSYKSPLYRLLGKKPDKKNSKDGPLTPDGTEQPSFPHSAQEPLTTKRSLDGAAVTGQTSRPSATEPTTKVRRNRSIKIGKAATVSETWKASLCREITNSTELKHLDDFLFAKINTLHQDKTAIEGLLYKAMEMFRENLKSMYSSPKGHIHAGYKDLMENFQLLVNNLNRERNEKDVKLVLNLFQSFLDEFTRGYTKRDDGEPHKQRKSQKKKRKPDQNVESNGHVFMSYQVSIGQSCEHCSSTIWPMEKAYLCSACKTICHKKCLSKIQYRCAPAGVKSNQGNHHFGVHMADLTEATSVPVVMDVLLEYLEMHGLYTEGIYRKSGAANCMRELKISLEKDPTSVQLDKYAIHAITGILKQWLRELPEPLMTFAQYSEFLKAVELPGKQEQLCTIYKVLGQLPQANYNTLERLIFHLVKVSLLEDVNRMTPNSLAIVFAPCLLRCPDNYDPLTSMKEVSKATACVEMLIKEQLRQYKIKMQEIGLLEAAETRAVCRLSLLRQSTNKSPSPSGNGLPDLVAVQEEQLTDSDLARESEFLIERIQSIKDEKEDITYRLPELEQRGSDEENMDSETSNSTESLLDDRPVNTVKEATCVVDSAVKPQPAENPKLPPSKAPLFTLSVPPTTVKRRPSSFLAKMRGPRRSPVMPNANIKLPPGLTKAVDYSEESSNIRRREQPGRRTDSIQSVYIPEGTELGAAQGTLEYEPTAKLKRRFSDPHLQIPSSEESNL